MPANTKALKLELGKAIATETGGGHIPGGVKPTEDQLLDIVDGWKKKPQVKELLKILRRGIWKQDEVEFFRQQMGMSLLKNVLKLLGDGRYIEKRLRLGVAGELPREDFIFFLKTLRRALV